MPILRFSSVLCVVAALLLSACTEGSDVTAPPSAVASRGAAIAVAGSYIVVLTPDSARTAAATASVTKRLIARFGGQLRFQYSSALHGFAVDGITGVAAEALAKHPAVAYVEPNQIEHFAGTQAYPGTGLDRIDQHYLPLDSSFTYTFEGAGANIYVVDSGIDTTSGEWAGRIGLSTDCTSAGQPFNSNDNIGHGTAVASVAAGTQYGVAKSAVVHSVRISSDYGPGTTTTALELCGLDWVSQYGATPAVVNFSVGSIPGAFSVRDAINNLIGYNHFSVVKSAGNDSKNAYLDRANRASYEIVVGAMDPSNDHYATFSDSGMIITIFAPGVHIKAANKWSPSTPQYVDGTSFSAPLVAGVVATYAAYCASQGPTYYCGPDAWFNKLHDTSTRDQIQGLPAGTSNYLLYSPFYAF